MVNKKYISYLIIFLMVFASFLNAMPSRAKADTSPVIANVVGNFQQQLSDSDWNVNSTITVMTYKGNGLFEYTTPVALKAGDYEYKIALNHSWDGGGVPSSGNLKLHLDADTAVTFWYNYNTASVTNSLIYQPIPQDKLPRLVGTIQPAIGAGSQWSPETSTAIMTDDNFDNVYHVTYRVPKGYYEFKVSLGPSWDENYGLNGVRDGANISLNVAYDTNMTFYYDAVSHHIWTDYSPPLTGPDNNIYYDSLKHDTHDPFFRSPFGAIKMGDTVVLRIQAKNHDLQNAKISYWDDVKKSRSEIPMYKIGQSPDGQYEYWEAKLSFDHPTRIWYYFILQDGTKTAYYGDNDEQLGGVGKATDTVNKDFELTVYDKNFDTPDWMKGAVNGDTSNDHVKIYSRGYDPIEFHNNWNDLPDNPNNKNNPGYTGDGIWSNDFFGGDLKGIDDKLDYLKSLGVSVLYLNPIFDAPSNHKYDTIDYSKIDPMLGTLDVFKKLMEDAHRRGIKVILDGVFNHTSDDSIYFDRYSKYPELGAYEAWKQGDQSKSPYGSWYKINSDGTYEGWWGFDSLPVIQQINGSEYNVKSWADFIINNNDAISKYWLNPGGNLNDGADGWRLDVETDVAHDFWVHFRDAINTVKPQAPMIAENWGDASSDLLGDSFNSVMNYLFRNAVIDFIIDKTFDDGSTVHHPIDASKLDKRLMSVYERYPLPAFYSTMNLLGSHDTMRILTVFGYNSADNAQNSQQAKDLAISRLKLATVLQMGYPGMPSIYYGDEAGASGGKDPDNRRTFPWGNEDTSLQQFFKKIANIRNDNQVLKTGDLKTLYAQGDTYVFGRRIINGKDVFGQSHPDSAAIVVINKGDTKVLTIDTTKFIRDGVTFTDVLNGGTYTVQGGQIKINVTSMSGAILISDPEQDLTAPDKVNDLVAASGNGKVDLSWTASNNANSYNIYRSTVEGGLYKKIATAVTTTNYTDTTVTNGSKYVYTVTAVDDKGNESAMSNEATAYPAYPIGWAGKLSDVTSEHIIGVDNPTEDIFAEVWADGLTNKAGQGENMIAQLGYKFESDSDYTWIDAQYFSDAGNNDKYAAKFLPDKVGTWYYTFRFSDDAGQSWTQTDVKSFSVIHSNDTTAPTAPSLTQPGIESSRVTLKWSPATDDVQIAMYEIMKSSSENGPYSKIATVSNGVYSYADTDVANGSVYFYKVIAVDTSFNKKESNAVRATPDTVPIKVTFNVTVPNYTPEGVNLAGSFPDILWNPSAQSMTKVGPDKYSLTVTLNEGTNLEYKYARGSWDKVEKDEYGNEMDNRKVTIVNQGGNTMTINDTVQRWKDIPLYIYSPSDNSTVSSDVSSIEIKGNTYKGAKLTINGEDVSQAENGDFIKQVSLKYGLNSIKIHVEPGDDTIYGNDKNRIAELIKDLIINITRTLPKNTQSTTVLGTQRGTVITSGNLTILKVDADSVINDIENTGDSNIVFDLNNIGSTENKAVEFPVAVLNAAKDNSKDILVKTGDVQIVLSKDSLDLTGINSSVQLIVENKGKESATQEFSPLTNTFDISIKAGDKDAKVNSGTKVTLNIRGVKDARKAGVYYYNEASGKWEYVGGKVDKAAGTITFNAKHFSKYAAFQYSKSFKDVPVDFWANDAISVLAAKHIVKGTDNQRFMPEQKVTRAEFAAMMIRLVGIPEQPYSGKFSDVKAGDWYANTIEAAYKNGIMLGYGNTMRPDDSITREEMITIAMRVYGKLAPYSEKSIVEIPFSDKNQISQWAVKAVSNAYNLGLIFGRSSNTFAPRDIATRAEAAALVYRLIDKSGNL
ncbi:alpha amylase N-terminal ig-like domain-containing protein [Caldanaerobius polysaccharolyticus]|uniref:alpha amylase N-terminal ig-like domain-containing protein n=1 Tax=Caldanaerobius polysaccharolyticus TaxID=44256 RepID=UPI00047E75B9|nr:alpha amylase N-terminal ig-like domain-containing protein [Caldanaerobius polysaccharolyticus]